MIDEHALGRTAITVTGQGRVLASPDVAEVSLGVSISQVDLETAQTDVAVRMSALASALKEMGIDDRHMRTFNYSVTPDWRPVTKSNRREITGYTVSNNLQVKVKPIDRVGAVIDAGLRAGANTIGNVSFAVEDPQLVTRQARRQAMDDARAKAEQLAELGGVRLGLPTAIVEDDDSGHVPFFAKAARFEMASADTPPTTIEAGQLEIAVKVSVSYAITG